MLDIDELTDHIRRVAQEVLGRSQFKGALVCTAYNPQTYAVKGMIQPHNIESGWIPIAALHVGNGWGIVAGPTPGDPVKLDGTVFDLHMDGGDPDTLVAHHRQFSTPEPPPVAQAGEIIIKHQTGTLTKYFADGTHQITHATGSTETWDAQGNKTVNSLAQNVLTFAGGMKDTTPQKIVTGVAHLATGTG